MQIMHMHSPSNSKRRNSVKGKEVNKRVAPVRRALIVVHHLVLIVHRALLACRAQLALQAALLRAYLLPVLAVPTEIQVSQLGCDSHILNPIQMIQMRPLLLTSKLRAVHGTRPLNDGIDIATSLSIQVVHILQDTPQIDTRTGPPLTDMVLTGVVTKTAS